MKVKLFYPLSLITFFSFCNAALAQVHCGTMENQQLQIAANPPLAESYREAKDRIQQYRDEHAGEKTSGIATAVVTIPVVVHVVYNTSSQNISDAQILSQITVLNKDYHKLNTDKINVPSYWTSLVGDVGVQFCMAYRKPNGAWTNGIERRQSSTSSWTLNDDMKHYSTGGLDAWDRNKYLNIWVCNLSPGYLGYAQFPGGPAGDDGVVITYDAFGTTGSASAPFNKGRSATHEIGHWFGLYHIWADDGGYCETNGGYSDGIADTPDQADETYGSYAPNTIRISCNNGPHGDMWMNYMDYTDDASMYMFSVGQAQEMIDVLNSDRASLKTSNGCQHWTGIEENELENLVQVFPNPASDVLNFDTHFYSQTDLKIEIFDNMGRLLKSEMREKIFMNNFAVDVSSLQQGMYNVRITTENLELNKKILIVR